MRLLVVSDTHGDYKEVLDILETSGHFDIVIHLGDETEDAFLVATAAGCRTISIAGNCDRGSKAPRELQTVFGGVKFLLTHGDAYNVKAGLSKLREKARLEGVDVALYGHTHVADIDCGDGMICINPGSLSRKNQKRSYAVIDIDAGKITPTVIEIPSPR